MAGNPAATEVSLEQQVVKIMTTTNDRLVGWNAELLDVTTALGTYNRFTLDLAVDIAKAAITNDGEVLDIVADEDLSLRLSDSEYIQLQMGKLLLPLRIARITEVQNKRVNKLLHGKMIGFTVIGGIHSINSSGSLNGRIDSAGEYVRPFVRADVASGGVRAESLPHPNAHFSRSNDDFYRVPVIGTRAEEFAFHVK